MNAIQRFVWGNATKTQKNIQPLGDHIDLLTLNTEKEFCMYEGGRTFYHKGDDFLIHQQNKYGIVRVNIRKPNLVEKYDAYIFFEGNVYVFVECQNDNGSIEIYRFFIGKKLGVFNLELPTRKKINKIYSVVGQVSISIATESADIPGYGCVEYATDALASYELIKGDKSETYIDNPELSNIVTFENVQNTASYGLSYSYIRYNQIQGLNNVHSETYYDTSVKEQYGLSDDFSNKYELYYLNKVSVRINNNHFIKFYDSNGLLLYEGTTDKTFFFITGFNFRVDDTFDNFSGMPCMNVYYDFIKNKKIHIKVFNSENELELDFYLSMDVKE